MEKVCDRDAAWTRRRVLSLATAGAMGAGVVLPFERLGHAAEAGEEGDDGTPAGALRRLLAGNRRFVDDRLLAPHRDRARRAEVAPRQAPFAAVYDLAAGTVRVVA